MKRLLFLLALVGLIFTVTPGTALAQDTGTVSATVTSKFVSVQVTENNVAYGVLDVNTTLNEPTGQDCGASTGPAFTVLNNGNVTEDFAIKGGDSTGGGAGWTLGATPNADQYVHRFAIDDPTCTFAALSGTNAPLSSSVAPNGTTDTFLNLDMPVTSTDNTQQTLPVTILATAP